MKKSTLTLISLLSLNILSCQTPVIDNSVKKSSIYNLMVSKKSGTTISAKIHLNYLSDNKFSIKANSNGISIKKISDIKSLKVYLLKTNTSSITTGGDPLNASNIVYQNNIDVSPSGDLSINFTNVAGSTDTFGSGNYYHIAVRAFDATGATGNELISDNNGNSSAWTGTTASTPKTAVSLSGIQVKNSDLTVSQVNNIEIPINLQGKVPTSDAIIKITDGNPYRLKSYAVNFCTDPTKPDATKVLSTPIIINTDSNSMVNIFSHRFELSALTNPGTYYLTVMAYDADFNGGNSFVRQNNEKSIAYASPDANKNIAVSTNSLTLDTNLNYSFSSLSYFDVSVNFSYFISNFAGDGTNASSGDSGQASIAKLKTPFATVYDSDGNLYIADNDDNKVRKVDTSGVITTFVGTGTAGFSGDGGQATAAQLNFPRCLAFDPLSNSLYILDDFNQRLRKVNLSTNVITTVAGSGTTGYNNGSFSGDGGQATAATMKNPEGLAVDNKGNIYIADTSNYRIRKIDTSGVINTIAGGGGSLGDGGQATAGQFYFPCGVTLDSTGNIYISDTANNRIRKIDTSGVINTIIGTGVSGSTGDGGLATAAKINAPRGLIIDSRNNMFFADTGNNKIRKVDPTGTITTVAGTGTSGSTGDGGSATSALMNAPTNPTLNLQGEIYFSDSGNHRVRKLN